MTDREKILNISEEDLGKIRRQVKMVYKGRKWYNKVSGMDAVQIYAIWKDFIRAGKIKKPVEITRREQEDEKI